MELARIEPFGFAKDKLRGSEEMPGDGNENKLKIIFESADYFTFLLISRLIELRLPVLLGSIFSLSF
jgi:hypothetical protein